MLNKSLEWLQRNWWGLIVAYFIVFITSYLAIWQLAEPLGIPETVERFPSFAFSRVFVHFFITILVSAYITLVLDLWFRHNQWKSSSQITAFENDQKERLSKIMHRMPYLQPDMQIDNWKIIHSVDESGNGFLYEELTIIPTECRRYFYYKGYSIPDGNSKEYSMRVTAQNLIDRTPLNVIEMKRTDSKIYYAIFLDHHSKDNQPLTISINCIRTGEWKELVDSLVSDGTLSIAHETNNLTMEFVAPIGCKWKAFHPAPDIGEFEIGVSENNASRIVWRLPKVSPKKLGYSLFLDPNI